MVVDPFLLEIVMRAEGRLNMIRRRSMHSSCNSKWQRSKIVDREVEEIAVLASK